MFLILSGILFLLILFSLREYHKRNLQTSLQSAQQYIKELNYKEGVHRIIQSIPHFYSIDDCAVSVDNQTGRIYINDTMNKLCFIDDKLSYYLIEGNAIINIELIEETHLAKNKNVQVIQNLPTIELIDKLELHVQTASSYGTLILCFLDGNIEKNSYEYTRQLERIYKWKQMFQQMQYNINK